ncbi:MAG: type restriction enzyme protein [Carnobacterium sp.]|uniref:class I SAM-dependent DNA methyltransferase n=1 Tax=Carnobacterium sp. TaxID=48221 RepID=UPI002649B044|nr:class I SAM-dependent DNA methyltransferase [Carnobacterium sp.]MDN5371741.1 type restriction enzyme protein [Carnobacterium sp.]
MSLGNFIKSIQNIMRKDKGVGTNDVLILEQLVWLLFLYIYDYKEEEWELHEDNYQSIIPEELRWRNWAVDEKDGNALTGDALLSFVDLQLLPTLKTLEIDETTEKRKAIVKSIFEDSNNYMKNGTYLRQLVNLINQMNFDEIEERHAFNDIYEELLRGLQTAGNNGQYFTPRALTEFTAEMLDIKLGETVADYAAGTGGFLTSAYRILENQAKTVEDYELINNSIYGVEKFHLPFLLGVTNLMLHGIDTPQMEHKNSFSDNVLEFSERDKVSVILMNPPFGSKSEDKSIQMNFPKEFQTAETADLFMALIMYRLKKNGRVGVILPDGFMFGDGVKQRLKEKLFREFNMHTIVRLPGSVFAPYTSISTNILFFDNNQSGTEETWYYELPLPDGYKAFSKTKPMLSKHFDPIRTWWNSRKESEYSWKVSSEQILKGNYNLDIKNPNKPIEEIYEPEVLIEKYYEVDTKIKELQDSILDELRELL